MKNTGIVRRIDDLGRIVIPKEIRKTLRLGEGDSIEIYINENNEIVVKKHSTLNDIYTIYKDYLACLYNYINEPIIIFDLNKVLLAQGKSKTDLLTLTVSKNLELALRKKTILKANSVNDNFFSLPKTYEKYLGEFISPIVSNGDIIGGICCFSVNDLSENNENIINVAASFLGKHLEYIN